jgi:hypothetical protein
MNADKQFVDTLQDNIDHCGAPTKLISDCAQVEISNKVHDILCYYCIDSWQKEPHKQHQDPCERRYQTAKGMVNTCMDRTGSQASLCFLCLL